MHPLLDFARAKQSEIIALIREFVECESPSDHAPSVNRFVDLVASKLDGASQVRTFASRCGLPSSGISRVS